MANESDNYDEDDFDEESTDDAKLPVAGKPDFGSTDQLLQTKGTRMNQKHNNQQRGVAGRRNSVPKSEAGGNNAKKKIEAYKRANERLRGELDRCIDSQFRVRELEDELRNQKDEMRKLQQENGRLEKMLEKPVKDRVEVDNGHVEKIRTLMNDLRLLQDKTRKYKSRAMDAERNVQRLTIQLGELQTKNDKLLVLLKEVKKDGQSSKERKELQDKLELNQKRVENLSRELQMSKKKQQQEMKKYRAEASAANKEVERLREKMEKGDSALKEAQMEARILSLKLRNERRGNHRVKQVHRVQRIENVEVEAEASSDVAPSTHRTAGSSQSKEHIQMSALEKSILQGLPSPGRKELQLEPSPPAPIPTPPALLKDELSELQVKMDALRQRQARVADQEAQKAEQKEKEETLAREASSLSAADEVIHTRESNSAQPSPAASKASSKMSPVNAALSAKTSPVAPVAEALPVAEASSITESPPAEPSSVAETLPPPEEEHKECAPSNTEAEVEEEEEDGYSDEDFEDVSPIKQVQEPPQEASVTDVPVATQEEPVTPPAVEEPPTEPVPNPAAPEPAAPESPEPTNAALNVKAQPRRSSIPSKPNFGAGRKKKW